MDVCLGLRLEGQQVDFSKTPAELGLPDGAKFTVFKVPISLEGDYMVIHDHDYILVPMYECDLYVDVSRPIYQQIVDYIKPGVDFEGSLRFQGMAIKEDTLCKDLKIVGYGKPAIDTSLLRERRKE